MRDRPRATGDRSITSIQNDSGRLKYLSRGHRHTPSHGRPQADGVSLDGPIGRLMPELISILHGGLLCRAWTQFGSCCATILPNWNAWPDGSNAGRNRVTLDASFAIQLCLEEAVANIIMYAAAKDDRLSIAVELARSGGTLVACIEDTGRQFDPTQVPPPTMAKSLEEAQVGGLGIHLIRRFASGMDYERRDGRNRLTLRFVESQETSEPSDAVDRPSRPAISGYGPWCSGAGPVIASLFQSVH
jgi:anti-sigma regulatory factor (Ser/Thr protein kinase)